MPKMGCLRLRIWWGTPCRFDSCYPQYARQEAEAFSASFLYFADNYGGSTGNYDTLSVY